MKRYKSFGMINKGNPPSPPQTVESYNYQTGYTPLDSLPPARDIPQHIQQREYQHEDSGYNPSMRAIRNFQRDSHQPPPQQPPQPYYQPYPQQYSHQEGQPYYPQYAFPIQQNKPHEKLCSRISKHMVNCKKCSKKYACDTNTYITIIVGLLLFIMFLLTKVIDKLY